jgi:hypothetical protein
MPREKPAHDWYVIAKVSKPNDELGTATELEDFAQDVADQLTLNPTLSDKFESVHLVFASSSDFRYIRPHWAKDHEVTS